MMLFLPTGTGTVVADVGSLIGTLAASVAAIALILVSARIVVPWLIEKTVHARSRDIFILSVIVTLVGIVWISSRVGISAGLGVFIAGLVISESRIQPPGPVLQGNVQQPVLRFRRHADRPGVVLECRIAIMGAALGIVVLKTVIGAGVVRLLGYPLRIAFAVGLLLSQVGEFSIVLLRAVGHRFISIYWEQLDLIGLRNGGSNSISVVSET